MYPGNACSGSVYSDDGNTFAYTHGEFIRLQFTCELGTNELRVHISKPEGTYRPWWKAIEMTAYAAPSMPKSVLVAGQPVSGWRFDPANHSVTWSLPASVTGVDVLLQY